MQRKIAVVGLGYVGLPLAVGLADKFQGVIGFDISADRIAALTNGRDDTDAVSEEELRAARIELTEDPARLATADFFIVAVPTPIDADKRPDLGALRAASDTVGRALSPGGIVVYESTVFPGATEEICAPILEQVSGLRRGVDFKLGYSPERINPGDTEHTLERVVKVVSAEDDATLDIVAGVYETVVEAGTHRAPSIRIAEAAKVIENTQRDLNIALMNEFALIFDRLGLRTSDILAAAGTKWNFLRFSPGLVGGHCIGVDPYYLTAKAQEVGYHPEVILAGRRINDTMGEFVAQRLVKLLARHGRTVAGARVGILGLTFKENVPDLRNSRVPSIASELSQFGIDALVHDPLASPDAASVEYGIHLQAWESLTELDALVYAVPHDEYRLLGKEGLLAPLRHGGVLVDVKSAIDAASLPEEVVYWSL